MNRTRILYLIPGALSSGRGPDELERRRALLAAWGGPAVEVGITENPHGPASIESAVEEYLAIPGALECALDAQAEGYDAIVLGCFGDPGLDGFRELCDVPVVGPCEASMHVAATLGSRFGIVTAGESLIPPLERLVRAAGLESRSVRVSACDVPVLDLDPGRVRAVARRRRGHHHPRLHEHVLLGRRGAARGRARRAGRQPGANRAEARRAPGVVGARTEQARLPPATEGPSDRADRRSPLTGRTARLAREHAARHARCRLTGPA
jgi:hypothetical protein